MITVILDSGSSFPLDITPYIMQMTDIYEEPLYVNGVNEGVSKVGTPIHDRLKTMYRFTVPLIPAPQSDYAPIERRCRKNEMQVTFTSMTNALPVTMTGQCTFSRAGYVKEVTRDGSAQRVYSGATITFEGWL